MATQKQIAANRRNAKKSTGPKTIAGRTRTKVNALKHGLTAAQITIFDEHPEDFENFHNGLTEALVPEGALEEQLVERIAVCAWRLRRVFRIEAWLFASPESVAVDGQNKVVESDHLDLSTLSVNQLATLNDMIESLGTKKDEQAGPFASPESVAVEGQDKVAAPDQYGLPTLNAEQLGALYALAKVLFAPGKEAEPAKIGQAMSIGAVFKRLTASSGTFIQLSRHETTIERSYHRALHDLERLQARRKGEVVMAPVALDISSGK